MGDLATLPSFQPAPTGYTHTDLNGIFAALTIANSAVTTNKIADGATTLAKMAALAANKLIGRDASGLGVPQAIDCTAAARDFFALADLAAQKAYLAVVKGTGADNVCAGNDTRLSDARTPTTHTHAIADLTDFPQPLASANSPTFQGMTLSRAAGGRVVFVDSTHTANQRSTRWMQYQGDFLLQLLNDDGSERVSALRVDVNGNLIITPDRVLRLGASYVDVPITPTGYLLLQDSNGNTYRIAAQLHA